MGFLLIAFRQGTGKVSGLQKTRGMQFLGDISFELYMTHAFVYEGLPVVVGIVSKPMKDWLVYHAGTRFMITFILCILVAGMVHMILSWLHKNSSKK